MSSNYYDVCNRYRGKAVEIKTRDGKVHRGIIDRVHGKHVFIRPLRGSERGFGGFGYGFYGGYGGYGWYGGYGYAIALGAIAGIALLSLFFW